ncbi:hypothetical protein KUCAC02_009048 [Chaenocephalus aceratus]|uniref:Uncharacterized protein n=1 Tax=Chaenocephalus aceratus TaxID=36190 RepID=A0ACB9WS49_CHAAC|nr:hypothetical protein KUCAC02_009048 [Chaenocephalus aceratus]
MTSCFPISFQVGEDRLQEKNRLIQSLQSQVRGRSPSSHQGSHSDLFHSDRHLLLPQQPDSTQWQSLPKPEAAL